MGSGWDLVSSSLGRPSSFATPPCRFWALCLHPPLGPQRRRHRHRRHRRPAVHRFFSSFLEMFPILFAASALPPYLLLSGSFATPPFSIFLVLQPRPAP